MYCSRLFTETVLKENSLISYGYKKVKPQFYSIMVKQEEVRSVAENARINLSDEEVEKFSEEFEEILNVFNKLEEVDTEDVEPAFHPIETGSESREDSEEETLDKEQVFQNTENEEDGFFKGPSV